MGLRITHVVVGSADLGATGASWERLGLAETVRLVPATGQPLAWDAYRPGPKLLEMQVSSLEEGIAWAEAAGAGLAARTEFEIRDQVHREARLVGPEGVGISLAESADAKPGLANILWVVADLEAAAAGLSGLQTGSVVTLTDWRAAHEFLSVDDPAPTIRTLWLSGDDAGGPTLQLLQFPDHPSAGGDQYATRPGIQAVGCGTKELRPG
jgi:hypothetical protein